MKRIYRQEQEPQLLEDITGDIKIIYKRLDQSLERKID